MFPLDNKSGYAYIREAAGAGQLIVVVFVTPNIS